MENLASIGDLASRFKLTPRTLRFWEEKGLVKPVPTDSNRRHYTNSEVKHVADLVRLKVCHFSLHNMKFWRGAGPSMKRRLLEQQREANHRAIAELNAAQLEVSKMLVELSEQSIAGQLSR